MLTSLSFQGFWIAVGIAQDSVDVSLREHALGVVETRAGRKRAPLPTRRLHDERAGATTARLAVDGSGTLAPMALVDAHRPPLSPLTRHAALHPLFWSALRYVQWY